MLRNLDMPHHGDPALMRAFHDVLAGFRGTAHLCAAALAAGLPVRLVALDVDGELRARELSRADVPGSGGAADLGSFATALSPIQRFR